MKSALKYAIKETPARLKLAALIDQRNFAEEQMRGIENRAEITQKSQVASRLREIETSVRLAVVDVILEEAQSTVSELDAAAKAFVRQVGTTIATLDDFAAVTKASGCGHDNLQAAYAMHVRLNEQVDEIGKTLFQRMNVVAAEAAAAKWTGAYSRDESPLAILADALVSNPMATLGAS